MIAVASATIVAAFGALLTDLGPWYRNLRKPSWQPPDWLFGPAWTLIFALTALAGILYWRSDAGSDERQLIIFAFALNAFLNILWSVLFFRIKRPLWSLYEVLFLWLSIVLLMVLLKGRSQTAAWLLVPYLLWVSFASFLNWTISRLNSGIAEGA